MKFSLPGLEKDDPGQDGQAPEPVAPGDMLSAGQQDALDAIATWYEDGGLYPLTLGGLAGTGKTHLAGLIPQYLPKRTRIAYCAYTGKAVQVLRARLDGLGVYPERVSTIHRLLYQPCAMTLCSASELAMADGASHCGAHASQPEPCPARQQVSFTPVQDPLDGLDLVVADEASMIPERLWRDLTAHGVPVLAIGDHGQLPPVQSAFSLMADPDLRLEEIHRQNAADPSGMAILNVARWAREQGHIPHGWYGPDVVKIRPHELGQPGMGLHPGNAGMILCATNATRAWHNTAMRAWHGRSGPPQAGDVVICLRNNYDEGLFNGQRGVILGVGDSLDARGERAWQMSIELDGLDGSWEGAVAADPFGQPPDAARAVRNRALGVFDFGYALTVHKCADDTTLILTRSGWKAHEDLIAGEQVLTLNPETRLSEWQPVLDIHRYQVEGEPLLSVEAESHSSLTTLNHRWPARDYRGRIVFTDSRYLYENPANYPSLVKAAMHSGFPDTPKYTDSFVELVAWFWTEGHILSNKKGQIGAVTLTQSETANPENAARIRAALLDEFGPPRPRLGRYQDPSPAWAERWSHPGGNHRGNPDCRYWRFGLNNAAGRSLQDCAPGMILRPEFILALTRSQLELFTRVSMLDDGYTQHAGDKSCGVIRQKDRRRLEGFQFACTLAGYSTVMRQSPRSGLWWMWLKTGQFLHPRVLTSHLVPYTGTVWCPETANGTWFAKRNETTYFTGNSQGSGADNVIVIEESWPDPGTDMRRRWLYTAVTRAVKSLTVVGW
jgi:AAA domain/UvrD-like helicase C-terminal domain